MEINTAMVNYLSTSEMIRILKDIYPDSINWHKRIDNMPPIQIHAVFTKFKKEGYIYYDDHGNLHVHTKSEMDSIKKEKEEKTNGHQLTLLEVFGEKIKGEKDNGNCK